MTEEEIKGLETRMAGLSDDAAPNEDLSWLKFEGVNELPDSEPAKIIDGVLHVGEKLGITASSKSFRRGSCFISRTALETDCRFLDLKLTKRKLPFSISNLHDTASSGGLRKLRAQSVAKVILKMLRSARYAVRREDFVQPYRR